MSLFVVSRRKVVFQQPGVGASMVVYVPGAEQVQTFKDAAGTGVAKNTALNGKQAASRGPQLGRVVKGQRTIYGQLPIELRERREKLKVWLAEDLAPPEAEAFFFIFSPQVIVHGVRERTDEGKLAWRTAHLTLTAKADDLKPIEMAIADYMFANQGQQVCLAVVNDLKLFRQMQQIAGPLGLTPVPLSTLKPQASLTPLYGHLNFTWLHMLIMFLGICGVMAVAIYYYIKQSEITNVKNQIEAINTQLNSVQINPRVGHIRQAQQVLETIQSGYKISPTALIAAAGEAVVPFGKINQIRVGGSQDSLLSSLGLTLTDDLTPVEVILADSTDLLLVDQADRARDVLAAAPWVRNIVRFGSNGTGISLMMLLQNKDVAKSMGGQP